MDPVSLITAALAAGAAAGVTDTASAAVKEAYSGLRALVGRWFAGRPDAEVVLAGHEDAPQTWQAPLAALLADSEVVRDPAVVSAAQALLELLDEAGTRAGKYRVDLRGARGAQVGDHNRQINTGTYIERQVNYLPRQAGRWPVQVGVLPPVADCYQERGDARLDLATSLPPGRTAVLTQVLSGLGGIGKTQLAARFARAVWTAGEVDLLVWLTASTREAVLSGYALAACVEGGAPGEDADTAAARFLAWLAATDRPWLVVCDDLADPADLRGLWPQGRAGRVIITTRRRDAALRGGGRQIVQVGVFTPAESAAYLRAKLGGDPARLKQADWLASDLGHLPLALAHAAAFILDRGLTCAQDRARFADRRRALSESLPDTLPDDYPHAVTVTWSLSIERADQLRPVGLAAPSLRLASLLAPNGIPVSVFTSETARAYLAAWRSGGASPEPSKAAQRVPSGQCGEASAEDGWDALQTLQRLSLISVHDCGPSPAVRVHALVQRVVREDLSPDRLESAVRAAADAMLEVWPDHDIEPVLAESLRDCADALRNHAEDVLWSPDAHPLLFRVGDNLGGVGLINQAVAYWRQMAATSAHVPDHPQTRTSRANVARWRGVAGDPAGAAAVLEELLTDRLRVLGPDHPDTLTTRGNLARWRGAAGDPAGAAAAFVELLTDCHRVLGADHPYTLRVRHDLINWRGEAGDPAGAAAAFVEQLTDCRRVFGPEHFDTLRTRHNLAYWRGAAGDSAGAAAAFDELLTDYVRVLGPDHPATLMTRNELANWRGAAGDPPGAAAALDSLLTDCLRILGPDHPHTLATRANLARWQDQASSPRTACD